MIHTFKEDHTRWLSNMTPVLITFRGKTYPSVEHAYMSAKIDDEKWRIFCTSTERTSGQIKKLTQQALLLSPLVDNWETEKLIVMEECLREKFKQEPFKTKLIETGNQNIQEGNHWNDTFWGVDLKVSPNVGENHLGRLIMKIRDEFRN